MITIIVILTSIIFQIEEPRYAAGTIISGKLGITRVIYVNPINSSSIIPPKYPNINPIIEPIATDIAVTVNPINRKF